MICSRANGICTIGNGTACTIQAAKRQAGDVILKLSPGWSSPPTSRLLDFGASLSATESKSRR